MREQAAVHTSKCCSQLDAAHSLPLFPHSIYICRPAQVAMSDNLWRASCLQAMSLHPQTFLWHPHQLLIPFAAPACRLVLGVYRGRQWALIEEHLHDVLGRQAREAGDAAGAAQHFMAMLACPHNSPHCQRLYLTQFTEVLQAAQAQLVHDLGLQTGVGLASRVGSVLAFNNEFC